MRGFVVSDGPLHGRAKEWLALSDRIKAAARGHGGVVVVGGPAGSGKTRLVHDAVDMARMAGLDVVSASCDSEQPDEALHAIRGCLGLATAPQGGPGRPSERRRQTRAR